MSRSELCWRLKVTCASIKRKEAVEQRNQFVVARLALRGEIRLQRDWLQGAIKLPAH